MTTLAEYSQKITETKCRGCDTPLPINHIKSYPHSDGWQVDGFREKQWLYVHCNKCDYDWSLWKLGVPR